MATRKPKRRFYWSRRRISAAFIVMALLATTGITTVRMIQERLQNRPSTDLAPVTQVSGCELAGSLPDADCTPGAVWKNATEIQLCMPGYSRLVRDVSAATKREIYERYGIEEEARDDYAVDHLVSLQLGGSNAPSNLWPLQDLEKRKKDRLENHLKRQICRDEITVKQAQQAIAEDWVALYRELESVKR